MGFKIYGVEIIGDLFVPTVNSLPVYSSGDEGKIIYNINDHKFYGANNEEWIDITGSGSEGGTIIASDTIIIEDSTSVLDVSEYSIINISGDTPGNIIILDDLEDAAKEIMLIGTDSINYIIIDTNNIITINQSEDNISLKEGDILKLVWSLPLNKYIEVFSKISI